MLYIQKLHVLYTGPKIVSWPARYPWYRRLWARLTHEILPEVIYEDRVVMGFTLQGPDEAFLQREGEYRRDLNLNRYLETCPEVSVARCTWSPIVANRGHLRRDYSPSKSPEFDAWAASFSERKS